MDLEIPYNDQQAYFYSSSTYFYITNYTFVLIRVAATTHVMRMCRNFVMAEIDDLIRKEAP